MDGVLIDSELHWRTHEKKFMQQWITHWDQKDQNEIIGLGVDEIYQKLVNEYALSSLNLETFRKIYDEMARPIYQHKTNLLPGVKSLITDLKKQNTPLALGSSARRAWVKLTLERHNLVDFFKAVVSGEDVFGPSKPDPGIFLKAAELLQVEPKTCVVIEDSKNGVLAAKRAGMFCVGIRNGFNEEQDLSEADVEVIGFQEMTPQVLEEYL